MKSLILKYGTENKFFLLFSGLLFTLIFILENVNGRFWLNDFKVYYLAADALMKNETIYGQAFGLGTGFYKYSPFVLLGFTPYCVFSFYTASVIHFCLIAITAIATMLCIQAIMSNYIYKAKLKAQNGLLIISLICILRQIVRELHMGNVNMILLFILCFALLLALQNKNLAAGVLIAIAILFKPYFVLLLLPLVLGKKIKLIFSIGFTFCISVIVVLLIFGWSKTYALHFAWIQSILDHSVLLSSNETIPALIRYYIYPSFSNTYQFYVLGIVLLLYASFFLYQKWKSSKTIIQNDNRHLIFSYFVLIALIPNVLITDTEHFMFSLPLIMFILNYVTLQSNHWYKVACFLLIFLYTGNSSDILGEALSTKLDEMGVLGLTNLVWIGLSLVIVFQSKFISHLESKV